MQRTQLCMVRHGETAWNAEGRVQGQLDVPLSEVGISQARAVAIALRGETFNAIYSSDLQRVTQTAEPTARMLGLPVRLDPRLRERHYGMFQTLKYADVKVLHPEESLRTFHARSIECLADLAARHPGESLLVFTHGGVLEMARRFATGASLSTVREFEIPNCGINRMSISGDEWSVLGWAECAHLEAALDDLRD